MSTEITNPFGMELSMDNVEALVEAMDKSAGLDPRGSAPDGSEYLNFSGKRGVYEMGVEKEDVDPNELFILNITSFEDGMICWKDGRPIATRLVRMGQPIPQIDTSEHGPFKQGDGWHQAKAMVIKSLDTGRQFYFKNNSVSGVSTMAALQKECVNRIRTKQAACPVISLGKEKFLAQGNWNYKPVFVVDGWLNQENLTKLAQALAAEEELDMAEFYKASMTAPTGRVSVVPKKEAPAEEAVKDDAGEGKATTVRRRRV